MTATSIVPTKSESALADSYKSVVLEEEIFQKISQMIYQSCGIRLVSGKEELVRSRLLKRLRALGLNSFNDYLKRIDKDKTGQEMKLMIDSLTTNKTSFFRETPHFDFMRTRVLPELKQRKKGIRLWSAGCSSGEEPYSLAILISEEWPDANPADIRILATDISTRILEKARKGEYEKEILQGIPPLLQSKYFNIASYGIIPTYRIKENIRKMVRFANLNLMASWPMKGSFDVIFCRNVMIYFDHPTQTELVRRFCDMLVSGGHLMVGHSESLVASACELKYIQPATYVKP